MTETLTDLFCGAGGSGQGAHYVPGVELRMAANHWRRAIDTHQANFPTVDHDCADISQVDPRRTSEAEALVVPYYGTGVAHPSTVPLGALSTRDRFGVAFIAELRGGGSKARPVAQPLATVTASGNHHGLVQTRPVDTDASTGPVVEDCTFRMLEPREIAAAMAFAPGYRVLGSKRDQVRQLGNAVTPPAAEFLLRAVVASLNGDTNTGGGS